VKQEDPVWKFL